MIQHYTYIIWTIILSIFASSGALYSQPLQPSDITCISLSDNGDITVTWTPAVDPNGYFTYYEILVSPNPAGPYAPAGTTNSIGTTNFNYSTGIAPPTNPYYFKIITHSNDGVTNYASAPSAPIGTIYLVATPSTNPLGYANLNWNSPYPTNTPSPPGMQYELWMERGGSWGLIQTMPFGVTNWAYEIVEMCDELLRFQVRLATPYGCSFLSNTPSGLYRDLISPDIPVITSISVDLNTEDAIINWLPSVAPDTKGYLIYKCQGNNPPTTTLIGTIMGHTNTQFTDVVTNTSNGAVQYAIAAFDSCYMLTPPMVPASPIGNCNRSIYLEATLYSSCTDYIRLLWQPYEGWENGVDSYTIYHGFSTLPPGPGNPISYTPIATVAGNVSTYTHHGIPQTDGYNCYYIQGNAAGNPYQATSNARNVFVSYPTTPSMIYLGAASVISNDSIKITVDITPTTFPHEYRLQRFGINSNTWIDIAAQTSTTAAQLEFIDKNLATDVFSYTYRIIVKNGCNSYVDTTNLGITMVLDGVANSDLFVNTLSWTSYGDWENGVSSYRIYREIDDNGIEELIGELTAGAYLFFEDDVSSLLFTQGKFCYRIEAIENPSSATSIVHASFSNTICLEQQPVVWIPNTFILGGVNDTFRPVISFADFETYRMIIFSRWGDIVYDTNDINSPWDGTFEGKAAPQGTYVYHITIKDGLGRGIERRGYINLLIRKN